MNEKVEEKIATGAPSVNLVVLANLEIWTRPPRNKAKARQNIRTYDRGKAVKVNWP